MRFTSLAPIALSISLLAVAPFSQAADSASLEFATGNKTQMLRGGLQWNWQDRWLASNGNHVGGYWDLTLAQWRGTAYQGKADQTQNLTDVGITPVFRWQNDSKRGFYGEAGVGLHLLSQIYNNNGRHFSSAFQFGDHIGVGYVTDSGIDVSFKVQHYSNGGIKRPNPGVNFAVVKVAMPF